MSHLSCIIIQESLQFNLVSTNFLAFPALYTNVNSTNNVAGSAVCVASLITSWIDTHSSFIVQSDLNALLVLRDLFAKVVCYKILIVDNCLEG